MVNQDDNAGKRSQDKYNRSNVKQWSPRSVRWLKRNTYASRIAARHCSTIGIVCRDHRGRVQHCNKKIVGDYPVILTKTLTICEVVLISIQKRIYNVIIVSDSQIAFGSSRMLVRFRVKFLTLL